MTPEERKRDKYYRKKYGIGLDWWNNRFAEQGGKCGICKRPQSVFKNRLAVDHDHAYKRVAIKSFKYGSNFKSPEANGWYAAATYLLSNLEAGPFKTKSEAVRELRSKLKKQSCRGLLCSHCNRGLRYYQDCPVRMASAADYLRKHQNV